METFANRAAALLVGDIDENDVALVVDDADAPNREFPATGNFRIRIDDEYIMVGSRTANTLSDLTRGIEGTEPTPHDDGRPVNHVLTVGGFVAGVQDKVAEIIMVGAGNPEGVVTAAPSILYRDTAGELYLKVGGSGNTGWVAITHAESTVHSGFSGLLDNDHTQYIQDVAVNFKGDLLVGLGDNASTRLGVGTNGQRLTADSTATEGVKWA